MKMRLPPYTTSPLTLLCCWAKRARRLHCLMFFSNGASDEARKAPLAMCTSSAHTALTLVGLRMSDGAVVRINILERRHPPRPSTSFLWFVVVKIEDSWSVAQKPF
ncbi:hypothetical protein CY34DRAFT_510247 [Suillus luteus UH-Slu-Lm8-n1]|uniref:Uncharacterized protein n=1 Tax=Suillus luteus UH-Slu-Lm8-n1 TaxID=930992 RepID=A0A0C9ZGM9_9AGAM|nr:hypothetical protein CY34DRAFT_510247 [Suillus luteus UH-Slu-Lm8-n1]